MCLKVREVSKDGSYVEGRKLNRRARRLVCIDKRPTGRKLRQRTDCVRYKLIPKPAPLALAQALEPVPLAKRRASLLLGLELVLDTVPRQSGSDDRVLQGQAEEREEVVEAAVREAEEEHKRFLPK